MGIHSSLFLGIDISGELPPALPGSFATLICEYPRSSAVTWDVCFEEDDEDEALNLDQQRSGVCAFDAPDVEAGKLISGPQTVTMDPSTLPVSFSASTTCFLESAIPNSAARVPPWPKPKMWMSEVNQPYFPPAEMGDVSISRMVRRRSIDGLGFGFGTSENGWQAN